VVWGSDYPHPDAKFPGALKTLHGLPWTDPGHFRNIVWDNPLELFGATLQAAADKYTASASS
jgi:hypothetical protein